MIRVAVVDDHPVVTEGLALALSQAADIEVAWTAASVEAARLALAGDDPIDIVLLDVRLPDGSGLDLLPGHRDGPPAYLVLSSWDRPAVRRRGISSWSCGLPAEGRASPEIVAAIHTAAAGGLAFEARQLASVRGKKTLTSREVDIVRLVAEGFSNDEVAVRLGIARKTVEAYLSKLFERWGFATRTELAVWAEREGWLEDGVGA